MHRTIWKIFLWLMAAYSIQWSVQEFSNSALSWTVAIFILIGGILLSFKRSMEARKRVLLTLSLLLLIGIIGLWTQSLLFSLIYGILLAIEAFNNRFVIQRK